MSNQNLHIEVLEMGFNKSSEGITYVECLSELEKKGYWIGDKSLSDNLRIWFYKNFYNEQTYKNLHQHYGFSNELDLKKSYLSGDATMQYLDYLELKESRESAKWASRYSLIAIVIATIAILLQFYSITVLAKQ